MRLFPILTVIMVAVVLYFAVLQRDTLVEFANSFGTEETLAQDAPASDEAVTQDASADDATPQDDRIHVLVRASVAQPVSDGILARGQTEAARQVEVRAETQGLVISEPLRKGAFVEAGQLLCRLDAGTRGSSLAEAQARLAEARARMPEAMARIPEAGARVLEAEARLEEARINQTAAARLSEGGFASTTRVANADAALSSAQAAVIAAQSGLEAAEAGIQSVEAGIESAQAGVRRAEDELTKLDIHAPFAGLLESDTAELGALMQPGAPCATVIQLDPIKLVGFVSESDVGKVDVGTRAGARLVSGQEVVGRVSFLSRSADQLTRTFRLEVEVPNPDLAIRDGQTVEIAIETEGQMAHILPSSSLTLSNAGALGVRIVDAAGTAQFAPVTLLRDTVGGVWLAGLPAEVDVILVGQEYVTDGVPVRVSYEELNQ